MPSTVTIQVDHGNLDEAVYTFDSAQICVVGRDSDCDIFLPSTVENGDVSRRHCAFNIDPPCVWLSDLNSTNGTIVNDLALDDADLVELHDGDEVRIGHVGMRVRIE